MLRVVTKKNSNNKTTNSIFHHFCPSLAVSLTFRLIR